MTVDGRPVALPGSTAAWEGALGKASRREVFAADQRRAAVTLLVWDVHGIVAYEQTSRAAITKIAVMFDPRQATSGDERLAAKSPFAGSLTLDGLKIEQGSTPGGINEKLYGPDFTQLAKFPFSWNRGFGPWTVTAITNAKGDGLVEVLVGE